MMPNIKSAGTDIKLCSPFDTDDGEVIHIKKSGFDKDICVDCAYKRRGKCTVCNLKIGDIEHCPNGYTYEEIDEINREINERLARSGIINEFDLNEEDDDYG